MSPAGRWSALLLICLTLPVYSTDVLTVIDRLTLDGLNIDAMIVDNNHEVVMFDCTGFKQLRFLETERDRQSDTFSFTLANEELDVRWDASCTGWLQHDQASSLTYVLSLRGRDTNLDINWDEVRVNILQDRQFTHSFAVNPNGFEPADGPVDFRYSVNGFVLKPRGAEPGTNGRLIIDDTVKGNIDIVELDSSGTAATGIQRYDYRARIDCDWPPEDPEPWRCSWNRLEGQSLALEWLTETAGPVPGLTDVDALYLLDPSGGTSRVRRFHLSHAPGPIEVTEQPELDLTQSDTLLNNGAESLTLAPTRDQLYISTRLQSFAEGFVVIADTRTQQQTLLNPVFGDEAPPLIDVADPDRAFLLVSDSFNPGSQLFLRVLRHGAVVNNITVVDAMPNEVPVLAHDPVYGLLYVALGDEIVVLRGEADLVFEGGFE